MHLLRCGFLAFFVAIGSFVNLAAQTAPQTPADKSPVVIAGSPDDPLAKAQSLLRQGNVDGAFDATEAALKAKPDSPAANLLMGQILFRRGDIAQANDSIQKTLKLSPDDAHAWLALSQIARVVSLRKKGLACVEKAHSLAPDDPEVMLAWAASRPARKDRIAAYQQYLDAEKKRNEKETSWVAKRIEDLKTLGDIETDALVSAVAHYDVPIDYVLHDSQHLQGWGVKVAIGNCKPVKLLIDTGADGILIGDSLAQKCGVKKLYEGFIAGIGSKPPVGVYTGLADRLLVGPVEFKNVVIDVEDRTPVGDESGLIGTDLLYQFLINLNLNDYKLSLDPLPPIPGDDGKPGPKDRYIAPEMASYARVFVVQDHLMIPTKVGADPKPALFVIDTGANINAISIEYAAKLQKLTNEEGYYEVKGVQGKVNRVFSADDLALQFAGFKQLNQRLVTHELGSLNEVRIAGLLGLPILRWFTLHIDYRDGLVGFDFHPPTVINTDRLR